jgi:hypothetical protein
VRLKLVHFRARKEKICERLGRMREEKGREGEEEEW